MVGKAQTSARWSVPAWCCQAGLHPSPSVASLRRVGMIAARGRILGPCHGCSTLRRCAHRCPGLQESMTGLQWCRGCTRRRPSFCRRASGAGAPCSHRNCASLGSPLLPTPAPRRCMLRSSPMLKSNQRVDWRVRGV